MLSKTVARAPEQASCPRPLVAERIRFSAGGRWLLDGIDITPSPGLVTGLIGPNGAGKSTLLRVLSGLLPAALGRVTLLGDTLGHLQPATIARRLAYMAQHPPLDQGFSALDMVLMGRYAHDSSWRERPEDIEAAQIALKLTGSEEFSHQAFGTLSGGEKQRVMLARALAQQTDVLLLDEPTASLDLRHQLAMFDLVRRLTRQRRITTLMAVHDLSLAARYCDELCLLHEGRVVAAGPPEAVLKPSYLREVFQVEVVVERHPHLDFMLVIPLSDESKEGGNAL